MVEGPALEKPYAGNRIVSSNLTSSVFGPPKRTCGVTKSARFAKATLARHSGFVGQSPTRMRRRAHKGETGVLRRQSPAASAKIEGDFVKKPGVQMIAKIAKALGVSVEELLK